MTILFLFLAFGVSFGTCYWANRRIGLSIGSGFVALFFQFIWNTWAFPTLGFFYIGTWLCLILAGFIGALFGLGRKGISFTVPLGMLVLLFFIWLFSSSAAFHSRAYRELIGPVEMKVFTDDISIVDTKHIRLVPEETALTLAKKVLGQAKDGKVLGSQLEIDAKNSAIQEVNGELWWIMPLDFSGFWEWRNKKTIPGYIRVSAHDPTREAQLIDRDTKTGKEFQIRYTPRASLGARLDRNVYKTYPTIGREEFTFEVDDNWRPYYTISVTYPTIGFGGRQTAGVIIANPQTGELAFKNGNEIPDWVDRVKPLNQALRQVKNWGQYSHGWWNAGFAKRDVQMPTNFLSGSDMWFVKLGEKKYWFTGMTSVNSKDQSLVGMMFVDTRSTTGGNAIYYAMTGTDENGVVEAVDSALGADSTRWNPSQPIPYNIYGVPTWVVPVVSREGIFQRVALVNANNINTLSMDYDLERAAQRYRTLLSQHGNELAPTETSLLKRLGPVIITRIGDIVLGGEKTFLIMLEGQPDKLFSSNASTKKTILAAIAQKGDSIVIDFLETGEPVIPIEKIQIEGIELRISSAQSAYEAQREKSAKTESDVSGARKAEAEWQNLNPDQKRDLINKAKEKK